MKLPNWAEKALQDYDCDQLRAELKKEKARSDQWRAVAERLKEQKSLIVKICQSTKHLNQIKDILRVLQ